MWKGKAVMELGEAREHSRPARSVAEGSASKTRPRNRVLGGGSQRWQGVMVVEARYAEAGRRRGVKSWLSSRTEAKPQSSISKPPAAVTEGATHGPTFPLADDAKDKFRQT